jgi:glycosyltransferase involved in cell wall biosynthesis
MADRLPLVSVAMPIRDGMPFLPSALESILGQSYAALDVIVVDDGSNDGTAGYLEAIRDPRVRIVRSEGRGLVAALNLAIAEARGELIARQDADDLSAPDRLARQVSFLRRHADIDVVACRTEFIDAAGDHVRTPQVAERRRLQREATDPERLRRLLPLTCCVVHGSVMARRKTLLAAGGYRDTRRWAEDYDLWLRLLPRHRFAMLDEALYAHRLHDRQVSDTHRLGQLESTLRAKLDHLRAVTPGLPRRARVAIDGTGTGARLYAGLCADYGLVLVDGTDDDLDLRIIAGYTDGGGRHLAINAPPGWSACGNFLVRQAA